MKTMKRILAMIGIVILLGLYLLTFIASIFHTDFAHSLFMASFYSTVIVPVMLYVYMMIYKVFKKGKDSPKEPAKPTNEESK